MSWSKTIVSLRSESPPAFGFVPWEVLNTIAGYESMRMIRKGQIRWLAKGDVLGQIRFIHQVYGVAV
jgi:transposase, IS6 family